MSLNYGFVDSLIKFFAYIIIFISLLVGCIGLFLLSFSAIVIKLFGGCMLIAGGIFFIIAGYILIRVIIQCRHTKYKCDI